MTQKKIVRPAFSTPPPAPPPAVAPLDANIMRLPQIPDFAVPGDDRLLGPSVVQPRELSPGEVSGLTIIGVDPTKPVPKEALERLAKLPPEVLNALKAPQARHDALIAGAMANPTVAQKAVRIEDLPENRREAAVKTMADMLSAAERWRQGESAPTPEKRTVRFPVVSDEPPAPAPAPAPAPVPPTAPEPAPSATIESDAGGAGTTSPICPRCGFDCRQTAGPVTDADRIAFLACVLALPARRFEKAYPLFGNRLSVRFRELGPGEQDEVTRAVHRRASADSETSSPGTMLYYANLSANYRMIASLVRLENAQECHDLSGGLGDALRQGKRVEDYVRWVTDNTLPTDSILVAARRAFDDFNVLCQNLREAASHPDFYAATD